MDVGRDELVGGFPVNSDCADVFCAAFVVKYLMIYSVATRLEARHETSVGWNAMTVGAGLEWFH